MFRPIRMLSLASLLCLGSPQAVLAHGEGQVQTKPEQKCIVSMSKSLGTVVKHKGREIRSCLKDGSKGKLLTSLETCVATDGTKIASSSAATLAKEAADCSPSQPGRPDFAYTSGSNSNSVAIQRQTSLIHSIFGANLDLAIISENDPNVPNARDVARCQVALAKETGKCVNTRLKEFTKCLKDGLKGKGGQEEIDSAEHVERVCLQEDPNDPSTPQPDPKGKLNKSCVTKLDLRIEKRCVDRGVDLPLAVPLFDPNIETSLTSFLGRHASCDVCRALNASHGLNRDCDLFDDGIQNVSCPAVLPGCADPNSPPEFESTFDGIQSVIFDSAVYQCSACHFSPGGLGAPDLSDPNTSWAVLVNVPSIASAEVPKLMRVLPGEEDLSFLYKKLAAKDPGGPPLAAGEGSPMPAGGPPALAGSHLEAIRLWIRNGASRTASIAGTAALLGACLPDPTPVTIPVPDPPDPNFGIQLQQTPWPLPSQSESEICMATYYDLTLTNLVPEWAKVTCPAIYLNDNNPSGECFAYHKKVLHQDPQSHHSIVLIYIGDAPTSDPGWGAFTHKLQDSNDPLHETVCYPEDPNAIDPLSGWVPACSGAVVPAVACVGFGPGGSVTQDARQLTLSQQPLLSQEFADGVFGVLPMQGITVWNSHAFNLTSFNSTMSQYFNLEFADPNDQQFPALDLFDATQIFIPPVAAFAQQEYCWTHTLPAGAQLFNLASHTHQWGVQYRIWGPPNTPCTTSGGDTVSSCGTGSPSQLLYESFDYSDPVALELDLAISGTPADRTLRFCSLYDNGSDSCSTPRCPGVKRQSTAVTPCSDSFVVCMAGPSKGLFCGGSNAFCDSSPGAGDGECDACYIAGGVTTTDEMFILLGTFYIP